MASGGSAKVMRALVIAAIVTGALYFAQAILVPIALAVLLAFMLSPLVMRLQHWGLGRILSVTLVGLFSFAVLGGFIWIVTDQLVDLANKLPQYRHNLEARAESIRGGIGPFRRIQETLREIGQDLETPEAEKKVETTVDDGGGELVAPANEPQPRDPVPVRITETYSNPLQQVWRALTAILGPLGEAGVVILFVAFILIQKEDLRDRIIRLAGPSQLNVTTQALNDAAERISRYLLMQFIINAAYGVPVAVGLYFIGVPNALLWGLLATVLRYLPYLGPWIAASVPIAISLAVAPDWMMPVYTIGLFLGLELISNNIMEPWLYGSSTGISSMAVLAAAVFWTWLWGAVGLLLSTPLTVLLVVSGRHVPQLSFFNILLGDEPVLDPKTKLYQRLLAADPEEAEQILAELTKEQPPLEIYDSTFVPALELAEIDYKHGRIDAAKRQFVLDLMAALAAELADKRLQSTATTLEQEAPATPQPPVRILCVPAEDDADGIAAALLAQVLRDKGYSADALPVETLASEVVDRVKRDGVGVVCISAVPPVGLQHVRYLCKRLHAGHPDLPVVIGLWHSHMDSRKAMERVCGAVNDCIVHTFQEALEAVARRVDLLASSDRPARKRGGRSERQRALPLPAAPDDNKKSQPKP